MKVIENNEENTVDFEELEPGDCFRWKSNLLIKTDCEQDAVDLEDGSTYSDMCKEQVTPVNTEVRIID